MGSFAPSPVAWLAAATGRLAEAIGHGDVATAVVTLVDDSLLQVLTDATEARKALDIVLAAGSAEVARRSARDLGYESLAQRKGHRNGTALVQQITGQSRGDVTRAVQT